MGAAKQSSKGTGGGYVEGFFHLFGWNVRTIKTRKEKRCEFADDKDASVDKCGTKGGSSVEGSSASSCASSVTDDERCGTKVPGVVARMMGLDSLPNLNLADPCSATLYNPQSLKHSNHPQSQSIHSTRKLMHSGTSLNKAETTPSCTVESKSRKKSSRPIEEFQTDVLPPTPAKSLRVREKKGAHLTEADAKIIGEGPQTTTRRNVSVAGKSIVSKVQNPKERLEASIKPFRPADTSHRPVVSNAARYLKGKSLSKCRNGSEETSFRVHAKENSASSENRGKSISLAVQAKANVRRQRERLNPNCRSLLVGDQKQGELSTTRLSLSSHSIIQTNTRKSSLRNRATDVLRQNNERQNCLNKDGLSTRPPVSNLKGRKTTSAEFPVGKKKILNKPIGNFKGDSQKLGVEVTNGEREVPNSKAKTVPRKRRAIDGDFQLQRHRAAENSSVKPVRHNPGGAEESIKKDMDVVSFTFTARMTQSTTGSESSSLAAARYNGLDSDSHDKKWLPDLDATKLSSVGKLELTPGIEFYHCDSKVDRSTNPASIWQDSLHSQIRIDKKGHYGPHADALGGRFDSNFSSFESPVHGGNKKYQGVEELDASSGCPHPIVARHPSPVSILDPFPTESCSSEGSSRRCSSIRTPKVDSWGSSNKFQLAETDAELSDSACPTSTATRAIISKEAATMIEDCSSSAKWEMDYVMEILCNVEKMFKDFASGRAREILSTHLFYKLESRKGRLKGYGGESRMRRKAIFDCVNECLERRCQRSVGGGVVYMGVKGVAMIARKQWLDLAEEVYKEICGWGVMGDCRVDELVDKDMSSRHGRWLDFEVEATVVGEKVEDQLLNYLVDEIVFDISRP